MRTDWPHFLSSFNKWFPKIIVYSGIKFSKVCFVMPVKQMQYWLFGYQEFSIQYNIGLKYRQYLYRKILKRYRIISKKWDFSIFWSKKWDFSIFWSKINWYRYGYRYLSYHIENLDIYIEMRSCSIKKYSICLMPVPVV